MRKHSLLGFAATLLMSAAAFAGTQASNTNTVSPTLTVNATIQSAVKLTLSTGTLAGINHCAITPGSGTDYAMNFGNVDGVGINAGNCNVFAPTTAGSTPAIYYTDYTLTPSWSGVTATGTASIKAIAPALETGVTVQVPNTSTDQANTTGLSATTWAPITASTSVVSGTVLAAANANGAPLTRFLGLSVAPTATSGTVSTTVTFTMTIQ